MVSFCLLACLRRQISVRPLVRTVAVAVLLPSLLGFPHNRHQDFLTIATKISLKSPPRFLHRRNQDFHTMSEGICDPGRSCSVFIPYLLDLLFKGHAVFKFKDSIPITIIITI